MVGFHGGDHVVDDASLERMHGGRPGMIQMAELRIAAPEFEPPPILKPERDAVLSDRRHLGRAAVHEPETRVVPGPADAVAGPELDVLGTVDLRPAAPGDKVRFPGNGPPSLPSNTTARFA